MAVHPWRQRIEIRGEEQPEIVEENQGEQNVEEARRVPAVEEEPAWPVGQVNRNQLQDPQENVMYWNQMPAEEVRNPAPPRVIPEPEPEQERLLRQTAAIREVINAILQHVLARRNADQNNNGNN